MAKTVFENENTVVENLPRIKQMVRKVGPMPNEEIDAIQNVDAELSSYINAGWRLTFVERLATEADGHTVMYVLTKD